MAAVDVSPHVSVDGDHAAEAGALPDSIQIGAYAAGGIKCEKRF